jgi:hypothetical protein
LPARTPDRHKRWLQRRDFRYPRRSNLSHLMSPRAFVPSVHFGSNDQICALCSTNAKPGKKKEVAVFLGSAVPLVNAEPGTVSWFAIQEGSSEATCSPTRRIGGQAVEPDIATVAICGARAAQSSRNRRLKKHSRNVKSKSHPPAARSNAVGLAVAGDGA